MYQQQPPTAYQGGGMYQPHLQQPPPGVYYAPPQPQGQPMYPPVAPAGQFGATEMQPMYYPPQQHQQQQQPYAGAMPSYDAVPTYGQQPPQPQPQQPQYAPPQYTSSTTPSNTLPASSSSSAAAAPAAASAAGRRTSGGSGGQQQQQQSATSVHPGGLDSMLENPFGPGFLPKVQPVTQAMRRERAVEAAMRYLKKEDEEKKRAANQQHDPAPPQREPQNSSSTASVSDVNNIKSSSSSADMDSAANDMVDLAAKEHNPDQLEMTTNLDTQEARLGSGILYLFSFVRFLFLLSVAFAVFQSVSFGDYVRVHRPNFGFSTASTIWLDNFMISGYDNEHDRRLWLAVNIVCIILTFCSAPLYFWYLRWNEQTSKYVDLDGEDVIVRFTSEARIDVSNVYRSRLEVVLRRVVSVVVMIVMIGIQVIASYFVTQNSVTNIGISFAISFIVAALNTAFLMIAERLTEFECWVHYDYWKRFHTLKLLFFRFANIVTVFAAKRYDSSSGVKCAYEIIGQQLVTLLVIDIFAVNLQQILSNMFWYKNAEWFADVTGSIFGTQDNLPRFDIALEYLQVLYRQYLVIMAMVVCPFSIFLSLVGFAMDYACKKFSLTKLCGVPRKVESSQKSFLTFVLIFTAVCGLLTPYAGSVFMLSGMTRDKSGVCTFP